MAQDEWHDPRDGNRVEPVQDDVYGDARHENDDGSFDEHWRIVYVDDEVVVLRSNSELERSAGYNGKIYRTEQREKFEKRAGSGRYKPVEEASKTPPKSDDIHYHIGIIKTLIDKYKQKPGNISKHKVEGFRELLEILEDFSAEEQDWTNVDTIGAQAASNLKDAGYVTDEDIRVAEREDLLDIGYVGESGVDNLEEYVEENT